MAENTRGTVKIALVGKYIQLADSGKSVIEALEHGGIHNGVDVEIDLVDSEDFDVTRLEGADGILIPGGFGERGVEGKIEAARYARTASPPRHLPRQPRLRSSVRPSHRRHGRVPTRPSSTRKPRSRSLTCPSRREVSDMGGTMRLGADPVKLHDGTRAWKSSARRSSTSATAAARVNNLLRTRLGRTRG